MKKWTKWVSAIVIMGLLLGFSMSGWAEDAASVKKVNINTANAKELSQLKGVGEVVAQRIIEYREKNGPFKTPNDLLNVKGVGPKIFSKNADMITIGNTDQGKAVEPSPTHAQEKSGKMK